MAEVTARPVEQWLRGQGIGGGDVPAVCDLARVYGDEQHVVYQVLD